MTKAAVVPKMAGSCAGKAAPNPQTECRIFGLPPELRNEIYLLVFAVPTNKRGTVIVSNSSLHMLAKPTVLSILQTCRLIRNEAEGLFYNKHDIEIGIQNHEFGSNDIENFMKCTNALRLAAIRALTVVVPDIECVTQFFWFMAEKLTSLSSLAVLVGGRNHYPETTYHIKCVKREMPILKQSTTYLPASLSQFTLRFVGWMDFVEEDIRGYEFDSDIGTKETKAVEATVMSSIARRKEKIEKIY